MAWYMTCQGGVKLLGEGVSNCEENEETRGVECKVQEQEGGDTQGAGQVKDGIGTGQLWGR